MTMCTQVKMSQESDPGTINRGTVAQLESCWNVTLRAVHHLTDSLFTQPLQFLLTRLSARGHRTGYTLSH